MPETTLAGDVQDDPAALVLPRLPSLRLEGKRALVTGAGRGLGLACAAALAEAGAHVTLVARTEREIGEVAAAIRERGEKADTLTLDVNDLPGIEAALASREPFDVLLNNAGMNRPASFLDVTLEDFDAVLNLNVRSAFFVAQAVARGLKRAGKPGSIIHMSSQMGHVGGTKRTVYCATKHAIEGLTKAMAIDLGPDNIRVNTIAPTFIETPLTRPFLQDPNFLATVLKKIHLGRLGQPEDVMGAAVFLASDAAALITGTSILVDGGWTAE